MLYFKVVFSFQEERSKQVVMGKIPVFESFGEVSCVTGEPMTCSIITATAVQIGVIEPEKLEGTVKSQSKLKLIHGNYVSTSDNF